MQNYFAFTSSGDYTGVLSASGSSTSSSLPTGTIFQPGDMLKLNPNQWNTGENITYSFDDDFIIQGLNELELTGLLKLRYIESILEYNKVFLPPSQIALISNNLSNDVWVALSGACVSYASQNSAGEEVKLGLRTFEVDAIRQHLSQFGIINYKASCFAKVTYDGFTDIVWGVGGTTNLYDVEEDVLTGLSQSNVEISISGELRPRYKMIKEIDNDDPTKGFGPTNIETPLCVGDSITVLDVSNYSQKTDDGWTWNDNSIVNNEWYVADVSDPCLDYRNYPINDQLFPIEFISGCDFEGFQPRKLEMPSDLIVERTTPDSSTSHEISISWNKPESVPRTLVMFAEFGKLELPIDFEEYETGDKLKETEILYYGGRTKYSKNGLQLGQTYQIALLGANAQYEYSEPLIYTFTLS